MKSMYIMSADDLESVIYKIIQDKGEKSKSKKDEEFLTIKEVIRKLGVSRTTLWRWEKNGYLTPIRVGNKVRYNSSEINKLFKGRDL